MSVLRTTTHQAKIIVVGDKQLSVKKLSCDQTYVVVSLRPLN